MAPAMAMRLASMNHTELLNKLTFATEVGYSCTSRGSL